MLQFKDGYNFDDVSKNGYPRFSQNKVYNGIISVCDVSSKILSRDSNYVVYKFGNSSIYMREVIITSML